MKAALCIQKVFRGARERAVVRKRAYLVFAATTRIQSFARGWDIRKRRKALDVQMHVAATKIESLMRGHLARKRTNRIVEDKAVRRAISHAAQDLMVDATASDGSKTPPIAGKADSRSVSKKRRGSSKQNLNLPRELTASDDDAGLTDEPRLMRRRTSASSLLSEDHAPGSSVPKRRSSKLGTDFSNTGDAAISRRRTSGTGTHRRGSKGSTGRKGTSHRKASKGLGNDSDSFPSTVQTLESFPSTSQNVTMESLPAVQAIDSPSAVAPVDSFDSDEHPQAEANHVEQSGTGGPEQHADMTSHVLDSSADGSSSASDGNADASGPLS